MKKYKYQMHTHTTPCSLCGRLTPEDLCASLIENGYSGAVITNHFYHGNSGIDRSEKTSWQEFVKIYEDSYLEFKKEAEKYDLDIIFSIEESVYPGLEILCYGLTPDVLYKNPQLIKGECEEWIRVMRENDVVVIQAHPYREAFYIPNPGPLPLELVDGIEVFNRGNSKIYNDKAMELASKNPHLLRTSSADTHSADTVGVGGIATTRRIRSEKELAELLRSRDYELIIPEQE